MAGKLPYPKFADVTPCNIVLHGAPSSTGAPTVLAEWSGKVNFSEKVKRVQDKDGQWVQLSGVIHVAGDILPGVIFTGGTVAIAGYPTRKIVSYTRPRNPDGSVHHTRLELI